MAFNLTIRDHQRLSGVHPDLVRVVERAAEMSDIPFTILEGLRSAERQKELKAAGASQTLNSRHIKAANGYGHAVDLAPMVGSNLSWDWPLYHRLAPVIKEAAEAEGVPIEWGGDWASFKDGPHWQLPWKDYPGTNVAYGFGDLVPGGAEQGPPPDFPYEVAPPRTAARSRINWSAGGIAGAAGSAGVAIWNNAGALALVCLTLILMLCIVIFREELKAIVRERLA